MTKAAARTICCRATDELIGRPSPFQKIVAFGYYDGPTSGVLQCADCGSAYVFEMLQWDEDQDVRVFALAPLSTATFGRVVDALSVAEPPRWPVWVPAGSVDAAVQEEVDDNLVGAGPIQFVVAAERLDREILAAEAVDHATQSQVTDWLSFLHLVGNSSSTR